MVIILKVFLKNKRRGKMKKKILVLMLWFLLIVVNLCAAGNLIVEDDVGIGTTTMTGKLNITDATKVPLIISNSTGTQDIFQVKANTIIKFEIEDDGRVAFFNSVNAIPNTTLGVDMYLNNTDVSESKQMFRARLDISGANATANRVFHTGNYFIKVNAASTNGYFYGMAANAQLGNSSADIQRLFGINALATVSTTGITGHVDLGGGINIGGVAFDADWDKMAGIYINAFSKGASGVVDNAYGIQIDKQTIGTTNAGIVLNGDGAGADIVFGPTQNASIYSNAGELFVKDGGGNVTQISPHDPETGEWVYYSKNLKTGVVKQVNMEKLVKLVEELTGEKLMIETIEETK
jgi:hypothetical protein